MTTITMKDMGFYSHHGCYEEEQLRGTQFRMSLTFTYDADKAMRSDEIEDAISYAEIYPIIKQEMEKPSHLIEHVAWRIKEVLMAEFPAIETMSVRLCKLSPPLGGSVGEVCVDI